MATPARAAADFSHTDYAALGDSYSSGVGAPGQNLLCLRGSSGYPAQWARKNAPASFSYLACSGADTSDVVTFQVPFLSRRTDLVTVTIGGNDAGFAAAVISCTVGTDAACTAVAATARKFVQDVMPGRLDVTYRAIRRHAPKARVVVLSYPNLFDTGSAACGVGGMSVTKRRALNAGVDDLDDLMAARARAAGFTFVDVRSAFAGHGACGARPWINGLTVAPPSDSFHPNLDGYTDGYLPALAATLA
jgi:lysophospholipase L1-like esterase